MDNNIQVTHNNDNHHYRIAMDIAKEGSSLWDLTPYVKGRVGDNRFGLQVTWTYQGQLMNIEGMKPYIEGNVGQYSVDDKNNLQLDPNSGVVRYVGDPADCQAGGQVTYYFPEQMFPKEGIFKGYIGLLDDRDDSKNPHISGVTVWFKVLPGIAEMGHACDYYISDLENAEEIFKAKLRQHEADFQNEINKVISDARNTYNTETENAHDALVALQAQIAANRDEQQNLSNRLAGTEQQIQMHDVVTRPEWQNLSNQLTQQVSQMKESGLEFFDNADDLKSTYPNGANKLCVTLDDSHQYVYDYVNHQWNDAGAFNYGTIDPKLESAFLSKDSDNLVSNSDFATLDGMRIYNTNGSKANVLLMPSKLGNSNILRMTGYWDNGANGKNEVWNELPHFSVQGLAKISFSFKYSFNSLMPNTGGSAQFQVAFYDVNGNRLQNMYSTYLVTKNDDKLIHYTVENYDVPADAVEANLIFGIYGTGYLDIAEPQVNIGSLKVYSANRAIKNIASQSQNLLIDQPINVWNNMNIDSNDLDNDCLYNGYPTYQISSKDQNWHEINSNIIPVAGGKTVKVEIPAKIIASGNNSQLNVSFREFDENGNITYTGYPLAESQSITSHIVYFDLSENTVKLKLAISAIGVVEANVGNISLSYDTNYLTSRIKHSEFYNLPPSSLNNHNVSLDNDYLNITGIASQWCELVPCPFRLPLNTRLISVEFDSKLEKDSLQDQAVLALRQYDINNLLITNLNLPIHKSKDIYHNAFSNIKISNKTKYINLAVATYGTAKLSIGDINVKLNTDSILFNEAAEKESDQVINLAPHVSAIDLTPITSSPDDFETIDQNTYNGESTLKLSTHDLDLSKWNTVGFRIDTASFPVPEINIQAIYSNECDDNSGSAYVTVNMWDKDGGALFNHNFKLQNTKRFVMQQFNHIKVPNEAARIEVGFSINGSGTAHVADFRVTNKPLPDGNEKTLIGLPQLFIDAENTTIASKWATAPFKFQDENRVINGYIQYAIQGNSSQSYEKKNLKIKLFQDENCKNKLKLKPKADWTANNKFNLKANWIDATQSRNLVNAQMVKKAYENTPIANADVAKALTNTQSMGQMEGFPIELSFNDGYYGLMTFNTKKDDKTFGMDNDNPDHECVTNQNSENGFKPNQGFNSVTDYWTEIHDNPSETLKTNMTNMINFINTSGDTDFKAKIGDYIDVYSVINTYLYGLLSEEWDFQNKSQLLLTWNGGKYFFMIPYDLDSTWGLYWNGSHIDTDGESAYFDFKENSLYASMNGINNLMARIIKLFKPEIKAQWLKLRSSVWRNDQITQAFKTYINSIPEEAYEREQEKWQDIPSKNITNFAQIQQSIITRGNAMDKFMQTLVPEPTDPTAK